MGNSLLAPAIPDILDHFGRPDSAAGLLVAATALPGIVVAPLIGLAADRFGRRAVLSPCLFVFGLAGIAVSTAPTFTTMLLARFALGIGAAGLVNLAIVILSDHFEGDARTRWIGANSGVLTVALALLPLMSGQITHLAGWRWALAPQAFGIVTALAAWRILEPGRPDRYVTLAEQLRGARLALADRVVLSSVIASAVTFAVIFGVFLAALPTHLDGEFGLGADGRGMVFGVPAISAALVAFNLRRLRGRFGVRALLIGSATVWAAAFVVIGSAPALWALLVGALVYGFGEGGMIPTLQDEAMRRAPDDQRGSVMAAWTAAARLGQTAGPLVTSGILAVAGTTAAVLAGAVGAVALVGLYGFGPMRRSVSSVAG